MSTMQTCIHEPQRHGRLIALQHCIEPQRGQHMLVSSSLQYCTRSTEHTQGACGPELLRLLGRRHAGLVPADAGRQVLLHQDLPLMAVRAAPAGLLPALATLCHVSTLPRSCGCGCENRATRCCALVLLLIPATPGLRIMCTCHGWCCVPGRRSAGSCSSSPCLTEAFSVRGLWLTSHI